MDKNSRKLLYPKDRKEYHEAFIEVYQQSPWKEKLINNFGEAYYNKVMEIHRERLLKNDFSIGPQSSEDWQKLQDQFKKL